MKKEALCQTVLAFANQLVQSGHPGVLLLSPRIEKRPFDLADVEAVLNELLRSDAVPLEDKPDTG